MNSTFFPLELTFRNEIATCLERAYPSLPISDAQILLFFPPQDSTGFSDFAEMVDSLGTILLMG